MLKKLENCKKLVEICVLILALPKYTVQVYKKELCRANDLYYQFMSNPFDLTFSP